MQCVHRYSRYLFELESSNWAYRNPPRVAGRTKLERRGRRPIDAPFVLSRVNVAPESDEEELRENGEEDGGEEDGGEEADES